VVAAAAIGVTLVVTQSRTQVDVVGTFPCASTAGTYTSFEFPTPVGSGVPCNVDTEAVGRSEDVEQQQRYFDIYSWQSFIGLMWPTADGRTLQPALTDDGSPRWEFWKESFEVFQANGSAPSPWGSPRSPAAVCSNESSLDRSRPVLYRTNKFVNMNGNQTVADELDQAFTYPLVDQGGDLVRYEVLINEDEFQYIVDNRLYNIDGQIAFSGAGSQVNFPRGDNATQTTGAMELKMAWKVLRPTDPEGRYYERQALVAQPDGTCQEATVGLVGMHISHKTEQNRQWVWATFEHVDNVATNQLETVTLRNGETGQLRPSFNNPDCPTCPVNVLPPAGADGTQPPVQVARVIPIEKSTQQLNGQVQALLGELGSVLRHYELVGTQWPTDESVPPAAPSQFDTAADPAYEQIDNKPGGRPHPVYLTNMTMETYLQKGNQVAQLQIQGFPFNETPAFGTESCMGCHYSAGVAVSSAVDAYGNRQVVYGPPSSGDFSWLLQLKAQWEQGGGG
jgi:hypothetical protein